MGDSDDEYHRRGGRDKFARERSDYSERSRARDYDYDRRSGGGQRTEFSNGSSVKRSSSTRRDDGGGSGNKRSRIDSASEYDPVLRTTSAEEPPPPVMMTFKRFMATLDDSVTDEQAIAKYSDYKMEFKRKELQKFFAAHKDEEWFRLKYHPDESKKRKDEQKENVLRRLQIFDEMRTNGRLQNLRVDFDCAADIIRAMDTLVVKLEGGTDEDVAALENETVDDESVADLKRTKPETKEKGAVNANGEEAADGKATSDGANTRDDGAVSDSDADVKEDGMEVDGQGGGQSRKKMLLHRTASIFLRNVAPSITMQEIETVCKRFPGFLRVGLAEPLQDRKFYRRGWVTFRRDVNIKEICWNLNGMKIRDCDLGAIVNRDIVRRVRCTNGITGHKQVAQNDLKQAARLTALYDKKAELYVPEREEVEMSSFELDPVARSKNPLLQNLTDFLIEEASAEEEELLGISTGGGGTSEDDQKTPFVRDEPLMKKLDMVVVYLRIVHSVDFYNHGEYPNEDVMPNRCGMMHVRAAAPSASQFGVDENGKTLVGQKFVNEFIAQFNAQLEANLINETVLTDSELDNLGRKDPEKEVEAFIAQNSVELAKDKWLCPLSGKKFKGPEFIRKHLISKHQEKLDQTRNDVVFFNNYLADPKRPQNLDIKPLSSTTAPSQSRDDRRERDNYEQDRGYGRSSGGSYGDRNRSYGGSGGGGRYGGSYGSSRSYDRGGPPRYYDGPPPGARRETRELVNYKDLDAPEDVF